MLTSALSSLQARRVSLVIFVLIEEMSPMHGVSLSTGFAFAMLASRLGQQQHVRGVQHRVQAISLVPRQRP